MALALHRQKEDAMPRDHIASVGYLHGDPPYRPSKTVFPFKKRNMYPAGGTGNRPEAPLWANMAVPTIVRPVVPIMVDVGPAELHILPVVPYVPYGFNIQQQEQSGPSYLHHTTTQNGASNSHYAAYNGANAGSYDNGFPGEHRHERYNSRTQSRERRPSRAATEARGQQRLQAKMKIIKDQEKCQKWLITGPQILCHVSHVQSFEEFYVQVFLDIVKMIEKELADLFARLIVPIDRSFLVKNVECLVRHNGRLWRGVILFVPDLAHIKVRLMDYGNTVWITHLDVFAVPLRLAQYSAQSFNCAFRNYSHEASRRMTLDKLKKRLTNNMFVGNFGGNTIKNDKFTCLVTLYDVDLRSRRKIAVFVPDEGTSDEWPYDSIAVMATPGPSCPICCQIRAMGGGEQIAPETTQSGGLACHSTPLWGPSWYDN